MPDFFVYECQFYDRGLFLLASTLKTKLIISNFKILKIFDKILCENKLITLVLIIQIKTLKLNNQLRNFKVFFTIFWNALELALIMFVLRFYDLLNKKAMLSWSVKYRKH